VEDILSREIAEFASTDLAAVLEGAELIILATPIGAMAGLVSEIAKLPRNRDLIVTDVGSVKGSVVAALDPILAGHEHVHFVGSHPMAGKELTGIEHACVDLFRDAACVITPGESSTPEAVESVSRFWRQLGCRTLEMRPEEHDAAVARVSHLPHVAASLVAAAALQADPSAGEIAGGGLRDTTRIASGSPEMWAEILLENRTAVAPALRDLSERMRELLEVLDSGDAQKLAAILEHAKDLRDEL